MPKVIKDKEVPEPRYIHPDNIRLCQIKARLAVYQRCKQDVTLFVNKEYMVGDIKFSQGVTYNFAKVGAVQYQAFDKATLEEMDEHKQRSIHLHNVKHGVSFRTFTWGSMKALGSCLPQGGNPGSGYGPYKDMIAREIEDIKLMFEHAKIADTLITSGQCIYLPVTKAIGQHLVAQGMDPLGSFIWTMMQTLYGKSNLLGYWALKLTDSRLFNANNSHASTMPGVATMENTKHSIIFTRQHVQQTQGAPLNIINARAGAAGAAGNGAAYYEDQGHTMPQAYPGGLAWIIVNPGDASTGYHCSARSRDVTHTYHYQQVRRQLPAVEQYWA
ncbi:hypothetical protein PLEOSDRAFT_170951 [Pleurotus ostreatus PC15]|uniref:Uncharacterized protein n=1 Tax=Pleurotus ostreatus (strain PC15) TaxID=1137138 RepID=A0A067NIE5_PLEO1|nr:hypothetical protein PLEOSDRAFT_170951 [Pleurotus ostreatus PC15]